MLQKIKPWHIYLAITLFMLLVAWTAFYFIGGSMEDANWGTGAIAWFLIFVFCSGYFMAGAPDLDFLSEWEKH